MVEKKAQERLVVLRKRVAKVPKEPGVYRWLDDAGNVLYVGKAKNLKNRMQTYVQDGLKRSPWTEILTRNIADFDVTVVRSELEALVLEANIIKELKPKFNVLLKDDKGYTYVRVSVKDPFPRIEVVRRIVDDGAQYFGPFTTGSRATEETLSMLDSIVHFRTCKGSLDALNAGKKLSGTPCLDHQIGKCSGLCIGAVPPEDYVQRIEQVISFFRGNYAGVKKKAEEDMKLLAKEQKFERAAALRDVLRFIEGLEAKQVVADTSGDDADIFGVALRHGRVHVVLLRQRDGRVIEQLGFPLKGEAETVADVLEQFLPQYYSETVDIPALIILSDAPEDAKTLEAWLQEKRGTSVKIIVPERGKKSKLLLMATRNAEEKVEQQFAAWEAETKKVEGALLGLQSLLGLPAIPKRIEGYDISHLGGTATVGSMVVMVNGKPKREHYRSFNMQTVKEGMIDDYKSIAETLRRRLRYLAHTKKHEDAELARRGLVISKARKSDQKMIEKIIADNAPMLGSFGIEYKNFIVVRRDENIVAMAQLYSYEESVQAIHTVWLADSERGHRLGQTLVRRLLRDITKGKVYALVPSDLEEYYGELGFQPVKQGPDVLEKLLDAHKEEDASGVRGIVVMYQAKDHKIDESFSSMPDLLLIDGGKGQLSAAVAVLQELHLDIPVAGLAKREEEIFVPAQSQPLLVKEGSEPRFLLQRLRDEAHRFANDRRERRLSATLTASKLDEVPGIGDATKFALLKKFGSADSVIAASDNELLSVLNASQLSALRKQFPCKTA